MMERRILKDFQIGIVESIVSEAVKNSSESGDVFSTIAQAFNKRSTNKSYVSRSETSFIYSFSLIRSGCYLFFSLNFLFLFSAANQKTGMN